MVVPALSRDLSNVVSGAGFEPANTGFRIQCLKPLGYPLVERSYLSYGTNRVSFCDSGTSLMVGAATVTSRPSAARCRRSTLSYTPKGWLSCYLPEPGTADLAAQDHSLNLKPIICWLDSERKPKSTPPAKFTSDYTYLLAPTCNRHTYNNVCSRPTCHPVCVHVVKIYRPLATATAPRPHSPSFHLQAP